MNEKKFLGISRILLGLMFFLVGVSKVLNPDGMISAFGFAGSLATILGWLWILGEVILGASLLVGYKVKYSGGILAAMLTLAAVVVVLPNIRFNPGISGLFFHVTTIANLVYISKRGAGNWALVK